MQGEMGTVSREMESLIMNQKEVPEIKATVTEWKSTFDGLSNRLDVDEERMSDSENKSTGSSNTKKRILIEKQNKTDYSRSVVQLQ